MEKIKVMVVDDHAVLRDGIRALLDTYHDIEVIGDAADGAVAVDKVRELSPDVVLMDIALPGMDGLEATHRITKRNPKVKVVVLTQHTNQEYVLSAVKAGAAGYVPKAALSSELIEAIYSVYKGEAYLHHSVATAIVHGYLHKEDESSPARLTSRENEILKLLAEGGTIREIADSLGIGLSSVVAHRTRIMKKLAMRNTVDLIKYAIRKGITSVNSIVSQP